MPLVPRFRKSKTDEDVLEESEESLETGEDEGLLMSTGGEQRADGGASGALSALDASQGEEAAQGQAEIDDLLEAAGEEGATDQETSAPAGAEEAESTSGGESSVQPDDDPLAAFRTTEAETETSDLLEGIEDVAASELLTGLREVRDLLGITDDDGEAPESSAG